MDLEQFVIPESKEALQKKSTHNDNSMSKQHRNKLKELPIARVRTI